MDKPSNDKRAGIPAGEGRRAAQRRLQAALRRELRRRQQDCRYASHCPVALAGNCPGIC
jgi:hypothetical protein